MTIIAEYHKRTKHSLQTGYAKGPETLDWDDQPNGFRYFDGCEAQQLCKPGKHLDVTWAGLNSGETVSSAKLTLDNVSLLLELAFGLSAWKQYGPDRWALRNNPSSGNLHPSEVYVINMVSNLMPKGVYHYVSHDHLLEQRCRLEDSELDHSILIGMSSIHWREAWKYGERAYRYCQLDIGHALAALSYAAACLGWGVELLTEYSDRDISSLLGLDSPDTFIVNEKETPELVCRICYTGSEYSIDESVEKRELLKRVQTAQWQGKARSLGAYHMFKWPIIEQVSQAAQKPQLSETKWQPTGGELTKSSCTHLATQLIRQRRSAQRFIPNLKPLNKQAFKRIVSALSVNNKLPFNIWQWRPAVHMCLFVHNVEGLEQGLYGLPRSHQGLSLLKQSLKHEFLWQAIAGIPGLYLLYRGDVKKIAKTLSCHQSIASDGAFSVAMLAEFKHHIDQQSWYYRRLFWECGVLGQILYLEAEAAEVRGTGIGCFFDDDVHSVLGIESTVLQSLYHFTVGEAFEDARIQTFPAYAHLTGLTDKIST